MLQLQRGRGNINGGGGTTEAAPDWLLFKHKEEGAGQMFTSRGILFQTVGRGGEIKMAPDWLQLPAPSRQALLVQPIRKL